MTNLIELKKQYEKLGEEIKKLEQLPPPKKRRVVTNNILYALLHGDNKFKVGDFRVASEYQALTCEDGLDCGIYFLTRAEAERELERRRVLTRLKELSDGHKYTQGKKNYFIYFDDLYAKPMVSHREYSQSVPYPFTVVFESQAKAQAAIDELGERINVLFNIN